MSDGFGGGFNSGGSWKSNVDNYYTYTQTSGGGGGGGKGCGAIPSIIIIVILIAVASKNFVTALIVICCFGFIGLVTFLILRLRAISNHKKNEETNQRNVNGLKKE